MTAKSLKPGSRQKMIFFTILLTLVPQLEIAIEEEKNQR